MAVADGFAGVTVIDTSSAGVIVNVVDAVTFVDGSVAVTVATPVDTGMPRPWDPPALLTSAMLSLLDDHVTVDVMFCVLLSLNVPVAVNCWL